MFRVGSRRLEVAPRERIAGPPYSVCEGASVSTGGVSVCWANTDAVRKKKTADSRSVKAPLTFRNPFKNRCRAQPNGMSNVLQSVTRPRRLCQAQIYMIRTTSSFTAAVFAAALAVAADLPVRQVVLYKHGGGYFERAGQLGPGESARLDFKAAEINDVLKSLTIEEKGGGKDSGLRYDSSG